MICIVRLEELSPNTTAQPTGWIIATDTDDAQRQLYAGGEHELAGELDRMPPGIGYGKHMLTDNVWMLVS